MRATRIFQIGVFLAFLLCVGSAYAAPVTMPGDLMIKVPEGMKAKKAEVPFSHEIHASANLECMTCHHEWDGKSEIRKCSTAGCHDQPGKKNEMSFYKAFHDRNAQQSCVGCHKETKKNGNAKAPTSCRQCHVKK